MTRDLPYKAVFFDVDETLVDRRRRFHPATVVALRELERLGVRRSLATGRAYPSARPYARAIAADAPLVLYNGAQVTSPQGEVLAAVDLPLPQARLALELAAEHDLHVNCYLERLYVARLGARGQASVAKDGLPATAVGDLLAFLDRDPVKLLCIGPAHRCDAFKEELDAACAGGALPPPTVVRSEPEYVEVLSGAANKGAGLQRACAALGIGAAEAVACGDSLNDLQLLQAAGLALVPESGHPQARALAGRIFGHHDGDGLGRALAAVFGFEV